MQFEMSRFTPPSTQDVNTERVANHFYEEFQQQREAFQASIRGIPAEHDRNWYASVLISRLMFIYFIQQKGFLNNNTDYLRERLEWSTTHRGPHRYYRDVLQTLFFQGLSCEPKQRNSAVNQLLGDVPYLNSSLFVLHPLEERYGAALDIPDHAFAQLFTFFDTWRWCVHRRSGTDKREIDPDMMGYILEKDINQKQTGAYYTRDDISGYICRSTIIPVLFDKAELSLAPLNIAQNISKYIYPAMQQTEPLPTETTHEHAIRRAQVAAIVAAAKAGQITTINDAITANLNLEALISDLIPLLTAPQVYALYTVLAGDPARGQLPLSVLDPTVGSGAFLFAALQILQPIYAAVLNRMEELVAQKQTAGLPLQEVLAEANGHANRASFITKSIILHNLYGVDLMAEAVEICKLRLWLRMVADLDHAQHLASLPDIDVNIQTGNALVGFAQPAEISDQVAPDHAQLLAEIQDVQRELDSYRAAQLRSDLDHVGRRILRCRIHQRLEAINAHLDHALQQAGLLWVLPNGSYNTQPFHWCSVWFTILNSGGFDVIVGNPPYLAYSNVKHIYRIVNYQTEDTGNVYAFIIERALNLLSERGRFGMIVPIASISTERMRSLQHIYRHYTQWHSHYAVRPGKFFAGVDMNLTITLLHRATTAPRVYSTSYYRWFSGKHSDRRYLFEKIIYCYWPGIPTHANPVPKVGQPIEVTLLKKMHAHRKKLKDFVVKDGVAIYYHSGGRYWRKALLVKLSSHYKPIIVPEAIRPVVLVLLNSQLFYWYWIINSNCMDVVSREVLELPVFDISAIDVRPYIELEQALLATYAAHQTTRLRRGAIIQMREINIDAARAKPLLDRIDCLLAKHYGFTDEELEFIVNYDLKYRMGSGSTYS